MSLPWETHYTGCTRRHPAVAYPRHACEECRAYERGLSAVREAVAALPSNTSGYGGIPYIWKHNALAAIDALRGDA